MVLRGPKNMKLELNSDKPLLNMDQAEKLGTAS